VEGLVERGEAGLSAAPAGQREKRLALAIVLVSLGIFAALAPFAKMPLGRAPAFIPLYQAALVLNDLVTAALLFAQCRSRSRPLFVLACGYLFTACMIIGHTLTFPGLFSPEGLLGAGTQSTAWSYMFWHALFPLFVVGYALSKPRPLPGRVAVAGVAGAVALATALVVLATAGEARLPLIMDGDRYKPVYHLVVALVWLFSLAALASVWRKRPWSVLDLWVMVVVCAWICEIALAAMLNAGRFDLGFYAGRIYGLAAASFVLFVLIYEAGALHVRLEAASAERTARAAAEAANRAKDQFLAILGHELRNPLAPIVSALQLMRMRDSNALANERLIIERQVRHLTRLVDDLLDVSRLAHGTFDLRVARCQAADIVARAVEMAEPLIQARQHRLEVDVPPGLALDADGDRLAQAICNLLANAAKFTPPGGRIAVRATREGGEILVRVSDNGAGIAPEVRERLFEPFAQGPQSFDRAQGGLGLGLAIVKNLAALHGGGVEAHSEGAGAEFVMRLPAAPIDAPVGQSEATPSQATRGGAVRVLVVDDNADAADTLARVLRLCGLVVRVAHDGAEALSIAQHFNPEVALLDLGLPRMDGCELAERLRALPGLARLRLGALTGYGQESDRARTAAAGFAAHFVKPVKDDRLLEFVWGLQPLR
jgi:signal transduction histidine kinase